MFVYKNQRILFSIFFCSLFFLFGFAHTVQAERIPGAAAYWPMKENPPEGTLYDQGILNPKMNLGISNFGSAETIQLSPGQQNGVIFNALCAGAGCGTELRGNDTKITPTIQLFATAGFTIEVWYEPENFNQTAPILTLASGPGNVNFAIIQENRHIVFKGIISGSYIEIDRCFNCLQFSAVPYYIGIAVTKSTGIINEIVGPYGGSYTPTGSARGAQTFASWTATRPFRLGSYEFVDSTTKPLIRGTIYQAAFYDRALTTVEMGDNLDAGYATIDLDGDGYATLADGGNPPDCDDSDPSIHPGQSDTCASLNIDDDCDGTADEEEPAQIYFWDGDGDGKGSNISSGNMCRSTNPTPSKWVLDSTDCDDSDVNKWQYLDGWVDGDTDTYGSDIIGKQSVCSGLTLPAGYTNRGGDCNDGNGSIKPGVPELCDGVDNDCDDVAIPFLERSPIDEPFILNGYTDPDGQGGQLGVACTVGVGSCANNGKYVCEATKDGTVCGDPATGNPISGKPNTASCLFDLCTVTPGTCTGGLNSTCTGYTQITCAPLGQCYNAGVCDGSTGACSNPPKPATSSCNDSDACTKTDTCDGAGACKGSNPVVCSALGQCYNAGVCNKTTGLCSNPPKPATSSCNDSDACTKTDTCDGAGACKGSNPVVCAAQGECYNIGTCDKTTGTCSNPPKVSGTACTDITDKDCKSAQCNGSGTCVQTFANKSNGSPCDDGNACSTGDNCQAGVCTPTGGKSCDDSNSCTKNDCNAATGVCLYTPDDTLTCDDGLYCTGAEFCSSGVCKSKGDPCIGGTECANKCSEAAKNCFQPLGTLCNDTTDKDCKSAQCSGTGICNQSAANKPRDTLCDDGSKCTQTDTCDNAGKCEGKDPVSCPGATDCKNASTCVSATGACSVQTPKTGTTCNDNNACTQNDICNDSGECAGSPVLKETLCQDNIDNDCDGKKDEDDDECQPKIDTRIKILSPKNTLFGKTVFLFFGQKTELTARSYDLRSRGKIQYQWRQLLDGPPIVLENDNTATVKFTAPNQTAEITLEVKGTNTVTGVSYTDQIKIIVNPDCRAP